MAWARWLCRRSGGGQTACCAACPLAAAEPSRLAVARVRHQRGSTVRGAALNSTLNWRETRVRARALRCQAALRHFSHREKSRRASRARCRSPCASGPAPERPARPRCATAHVGRRADRSPLQSRAPSKTARRLRVRRVGGLPTLVLSGSYQGLVNNPTIMCQQQSDGKSRRRRPLQAPPHALGRRRRLPGAAAARYTRRCARVNAYCVNVLCE
jgi:hypothetical protein